MPCERFDWQAMPSEQLNPGLARQFLSGQKLTVARFRFSKGRSVPAHSHENEQVACVLEGALRFRLEDQTAPEGGRESGGARELEIRAGQALLIPSYVVHSAEALEDSVVLDIFSPVRQDWLSGVDAYLRG